MLSDTCATGLKKLHLQVDNQKNNVPFLLISKTGKGSVGIFLSSRAFVEWPGMMQMSSDDGKMRRTETELFSSITSVPSNR